MMGGKVGPVDAGQSRRYAAPSSNQLIDERVAVRRGAEVGDDRAATRSCSR